MGGGLVAGVVLGAFGLLAGALYGLFVGNVVSARRRKNSAVPVPPDSSLAFLWTDGDFTDDVATVVGRVYLPGAFASSADQFGVLGLAFSYIGWLFVLMSVLLVAVTIGRVIHLTVIGQLWSRSGGTAAAPTPPRSLD